MPSGASPASRCGSSRKSACSRRTRPANSAEAGAGALQRLAVAVEAEQPAVGRARAQDRRGVAAEADGAVDPEPARPHGEQLQRLGEQDAGVARIR